VHHGGGPPGVQARGAEADAGREVAQAGFVRGGVRGAAARGRGGGRDGAGRGGQHEVRCVCDLELEHFSTS
jgi:hypothetical protein